MRRAIIDNSTLTAIQRLLGNIEVCNKHTMDGDILAFETLIQAILFFDDVCYIDDYKQQYREERASFFPFLGQVNIDEKNYEVLLRETDKLSNNIIPRVEGGVFTDNDFKPFFELLKMHNIFTWDMSSSVYYLTQKMLAGNHNEIDIEKYSKLTQMIFSELQDNSAKKQVNTSVILDSRGKPITSDYTVIDKEGNVREAHIGRQTELFMANLSWLAYRTIFYTLVAKQMGGTLILHPIRDAFQINYFQRLFPQKPNWCQTLIKAMNVPVEETVKLVFASTQPVITKYTMPLFSAAITEKSGNPKDAINVALHMKEEGAFVEARRKLLEIDELFSEDKSQKAIREANKLVNHVEILMKQICEKYYVSTPQGVTLSPIIQAYNIGSLFSQGVLPSIPNFSAKIGVLGKLKDWIPQTGFNAIYKSLINDLTSIGKLGKYHELLTSQVVYNEDANYYDSKMEDKKYMKLKSNWKIPM
ncbi:hypothetical protein HNQ56_002243 [Anaerotaenia torta]|uniref:hypothetical protein n=1 Tax=Anaerotaenia torta TaxID=433293 RepID=UPI003D1A6117